MTTPTVTTPSVSVPSAPAVPSAVPSAGTYSDIEIYDKPVSSSPLQESAQRQIESSTYDYQPAAKPATYGTPTYGETDLAGAPTATPTDNAPYYPGREKGSQIAPSATTAQSYSPPTQTRAPAPQNYAGPTPAKRGNKNKWLQKIGLGGIKFVANGFAKIGGAFTDRDGVGDDQ